MQHARAIKYILRTNGLVDTLDEDLRLLKKAEEYKKIFAGKCLGLTVASLYTLQTRTFFPNDIMCAAALLCIISAAACIADYFFVNKHKQFSLLERQAIRLTSTALKNCKTFTPTKTDAEVLSKFYTNALGNIELNKRLESALETDDAFISAHNQVISLLYKFTYKTQDYKTIPALLDKLDKLITSDANTALNDDEKITLAELRKINKFLGTSKVATIVKFFVLSRLNLELSLQSDKKISTGVSTEIMDFTTLHENAETLCSKFHELIAAQIPYTDGDIIMSVGNRCKHYYGVQGLTEHALFSVENFFSPYTHAAISIKEKNKHVVSHIVAYYRRDDVEEIDSLFSRAFTVNPYNLVQNDIIKNKICEALGTTDGYLSQIMYLKYRAIAQRLHNNASLREPKLLENNTDRIWWSIPTDFILGHRRTKKPVRTWAQEVLMEEDRLGHKLQETSADGYITCSEFAAKMTVLTLMALEKELLEEILAKDPTFAMPKEGLLKMPFHEFEDLDRVGPTHLISELTKVGAIEKISKAKVMKNIVNMR